MNTNEILLSITIPTYNRASILDISLAKIRPQIESAKYKIEFIISDNCSSDNTQEIVSKYIKMGIPIKYIRNNENIGMDGNFLQCFKQAHGKYVWLLGDDDLLLDNSLNDILEVLSSGDFGLLHIDLSPNKKKKSVLYKNPGRFISKMSYWITFISSNIVNTRYINNIDFDKYRGTFIIHIPLYLDAAIEGKNNVILFKNIFDTSDNGINNGGYNYFEVFVKNYLTIWKNCTKKIAFHSYLYEKEKCKIFTDHTIRYVSKFLFKNQRGNFKTDNAWHYLFRFYWYLPYFYFYLVIFFIKSKLTLFKKI
jgi:glycosyltransferase involved in cell wall biosynthesis